MYVGARTELWVNNVHKVYEDMKFKLVGDTYFKKNIMRF